MATPAPHIDPMTSMFDSLAARVADIVTERLKPAITASRSEVFTEESGLVPLKVYTAKEVAELLSIQRVESIYEIPESELPRVKRVGKHFGYLGINILCYIHNMQPVDMNAVIDGYKEQLQRSKPKISALHPDRGGLTRVM